MKITIVALGKARGFEAEWCAEYLKRLGPGTTLKEFTASKSLPAAATQEAEADLLLKNIPAKSWVVLLDERGKDLPSRDLAAKVEQWQQTHGAVTFLIGGADGVTEDVRQRADFTLGFGRSTWPHRLVRVMLLEQIYRAQQIISGHPYHRD